jgi:hypothetical protein
MSINIKFNKGYDIQENIFEKTSLNPNYALEKIIDSITPLSKFFNGYI